MFIMFDFGVGYKFDRLPASQCHKMSCYSTAWDPCDDDGTIMQDKVGSRTLEGRRLRRHVLKGAVIVFITAGYSGKKFIFEKVCDSQSCNPSSAACACAT